MMFGSSTNFLFIEASFFTVRNVVATRKCFYMCLSYCPQGGCLADTPPGRHPPGRQTPPGQTPPWQADTPRQADTRQGRPLQRTVRILLECILVKNNFAPPIIDLNFNYGYLKNTSRVTLQTFVLNLNEN